MSVAPSVSRAAASLMAARSSPLRRQAQQRQAAIGVAGAQPVQRLAGARQRVGEIGGRDAFRADALGPGILDRLMQRHPTGRDRLSGERTAPRNTPVPAKVPVRQT